MDKQAIGDSESERGSGCRNGLMLSPGFDSMPASAMARRFRWSDKKRRTLNKLGGFIVLRLKGLVDLLLR